MRFMVSVSAASRFFTQIADSTNIAIARHLRRVDKQRVDTAACHSTPKAALYASMSDRKSI